MHFRVTVRKLNVTDRRTDAQTDRHCNTSRPGPSAGDKKLLKRFRDWPFPSLKWTPPPTSAFQSSTATWHSGAKNSKEILCTCMFSSSLHQSAGGEPTKSMHNANLRFSMIQSTGKTFFQPHTRRSGNNKNIDYIYIFQDPMNIYKQ